MVGLQTLDLAILVRVQASQPNLTESVAMKISGHKTRDVFERYNIKDRRDIVEAMEKLARHQRAEDRKLDRPGARPN